MLAILWIEFCEVIWSWAFVCWEIFYQFQFQCLWLVCSYFLLLPDSVLEGCTFLRNCPFLPGCPFYQHLTAPCCSAARLCPPLCDLMDCSMPGFSVLHHLPELAQTHVHWVDANHLILCDSFLSCLDVSQHQGLF